MRRGEDVYAALGQTEAGRYLIVFFYCESSAPCPRVVSQGYDPERKKKI